MQERFKDSNGPEVWGEMIASEYAEFLRNADAAILPSCPFVPVSAEEKSRDCISPCSDSM
jgi:hypothetical protein